MPPELQERLDACTKSERDAIARAWQLAILGRDIDQTEIPDFEALWNRISPYTEKSSDNYAQSLHLDRRALDRSSIKRQRNRLLGYTVPALVLLLIVFGFFWWRQLITLTAPIGELLSARTPDGSLIELNSGSRLVYQRSFPGWNRLVQLEGEAFFDVVPNRQAFIVQTFNAAVTVHGTSFNVRARLEDSPAETVVVLASGEVELSALEQPGCQVRLEPGQMSRLPFGELTPHTPQAVSVDRALSWRSGGFAFDDVLLHTILEEIERRYDITINASQELLEEKLVLFLAPQPDGDTVLDIICGFLDCRYEVKNSGYHIFALDTS